MQRLETIFEWCNDITEMRRFYTDLLGLEETFFNADYGWLRHRIGDFETAFIVAPQPVPVIDAWAVTPTLADGVAFVASWLLEVDHDTYTSILARLQGAGINIIHGPEAESMVNVFVRDPMGKTIEIYAQKT